MLSHELKEALLTTQLFQYLEPPELDLMISHSKLVHFNPGDVILKQGQANTKMYIIVDGEAVVEAKILGEGTTSIATLGRGNFLGEISVIEKGPCSASVIANSKVDCLLISDSYFTMLTMFSPETKYKIAWAVTRQVCVRLKELHRQITLMMPANGSLPEHPQASPVSIRPKPITLAEAQTDQSELLASPLFNQFTAEDIDNILTNSTLLEVERDYQLIKENDREGLCCILLHGAVQTSIIKNGKTVKLSVISPFNIFGNISLIDDSSTALVNYNVCEHAIICLISEANVVLLQKKYLATWQKLFELLCKSFVVLERAADKLHIRLNSELYNKSIDR